MNINVGVGKAFKTACTISNKSGIMPQCGFPDLIDFRLENIYHVYSETRRSID